MPGVYVATVDNLDATPTLRRYDPNTLTAQETLSDITRVTSTSQYVWAVGTGTRVDRLLRVEHDDVASIVETVTLPTGKTPVYVLSDHDSDLYLYMRRYVPEYVTFPQNVASANLLTSSTSTTTPTAIDIRTRCVRDDWQEVGTKGLVRRTNAFSLLLSSGTWTLQVRSGGTLRSGTETATNLGCVDGEYRWLRFTYNNVSYGGDNPTAEWRVRFWTSDDGATWTQYSYDALAGGALDAASAGITVSGTGSSGSGFDGSVSDLVIYDENDDLIHDISLADSSDIDDKAWTSSTTSEAWTLGSNRTVFGFVHTLDRRDPQTGVPIWTLDLGTQIGGLYEQSGQVNAVVADDMHAYVTIGGAGGFTGVAKVNRATGVVDDDLAVSPTPVGATAFGGYLYVNHSDGIDKIDTATMLEVDTVNVTLGSDLSNDGTSVFLGRTGAALELRRYDTDLTLQTTQSTGGLGGLFVDVDNYVYTTNSAIQSGTLTLGISARDRTTLTSVQSTTATNLTPVALSVMYQAPPTPGAAGWVVGAVGW